jgi:hypothetical protein
MTLYADTRLSSDDGELKRSAHEPVLVADLLPEHTTRDPNAPAPGLPVTLDMPGKVAGFLRTIELEPAE